MPNSRSIKSLLLAAMLTWAAGSASATTLIPADFAQMARESELIVRGTVVNVQGQLGGPGRTIESLVTVFVAATLKGTTGTQTVFRVPGGRVGPYRRVMVGAPEFSAGDEVIVFLKGRAPSIAMPYGLSQGVYRISRHTGSAVVTPAVTGNGRVVRGDPARRPLDPEAFARHVQQALTATATAPTDARRAIPRAR